MSEYLTILKKRILKIEGELHPFESSIMQNAEHMLEIKLSDEFKLFNSIHEYDCFGYYGFYNWFQKGNASVIGETLGYRKNLNLPHEYLVLYEDDVTCILLQTKKDSAEPSPVIFLPIEEVDNLCTTNTIPANAEVLA